MVVEYGLISRLYYSISFSCSEARLSNTILFTRNTCILHTVIVLSLFHSLSLSLSHINKNCKLSAYWVSAWDQHVANIFSCFRIKNWLKKKIFVQKIQFRSSYDYVNCSTICIIIIHLTYVLIQDPAE